MRLPRLAVLLALAGLVAAALGRGPRPLPAEMHAYAMASIDLVYREEFEAAFETARAIIQKQPDHPAGYFFCAAALDAWMRHHQSNAREDVFYRYCNLAVEKATALEDKGKEDAWSMFFKGGAEGLKGNYEMRYERWITAFRYGWKGVTVLRDVQEEYRDMPDVAYGVGSYLYWRSAMARVLKWLPGVKDERAKGIELLQIARQQGIYTRVASSEALVAAMLNERQYQTALGIVDSLLLDYPVCMTLQMKRASALYGLGRKEDAERVYHIVLARALSSPEPNLHTAVVARYWLARIHFEHGRYASCIAECEGVLTYSLPGSEQRRLDEYLSGVRELRQQAAEERTQGRR